MKLKLLSVANRSQSVAATDRKRAVISYLEENGQARVADFVSVIRLSDGRVRALLREIWSTMEQSRKSAIKDILIMF
jgi:hypothetical protein